jgi:glycosyltransferase involved in cell wall biosynthesis
MFVAGFRHRPNVDAALWLMHHVLPKVREAVPDLTTILAGSNPPPEVTALATDDVVVTGYVSDPLLHRLYRTASVIVAPLRFGGGVKGKIIEALRFGVPVATTPAGAQGMVGGTNYLEIGDTPNALADCVIRLLNDPELRATRALSGLDYIEHEFSYRSVVKRMAADMPELKTILEGHRALTR